MLHLCVSQRPPHLHEIVVKETEVIFFFPYQLLSTRQGKHNQCDMGALCAFTGMLARRTSEGLQPKLPSAAGSGSLSHETSKDGGWSRPLQCCSTLLPKQFLHLFNLKNTSHSQSYCLTFENSLAPSLL